jgi:hypothetical protein
MEGSSTGGGEEFDRCRFSALVTEVRVRCGDEVGTDLDPKLELSWDGISSASLYTVGGRVLKVLDDTLGTRP